MADDIKLPEMPEPDATYGHDFWMAESMVSYARAAVEADRARHARADSVAPKNCLQVPPGNGFCDQCASGNPELCRYVPAPKGGE